MLLETHIRFQFNLSNMKVSEHESINKMYEFVKNQGLTNIVDRFESYQTRCKYCSEGVSCQLCSMGPCRITPKTPTGSCGADADLIAMRNMLHLNVLGTAAYTHHFFEAARTLKATAEGKAPFEIKDAEKLKKFASTLGIEGEDINEIAIKTADFVMNEASKPFYERSKLVEAFAPKKRLEVWEKLDLIPGGTFGEMLVTLSSSMTNVDCSFQSLALKALRLGIATAFNSQLPLEVFQDVLFGTPKPHKTYADLGVIEPEYINIAVNGHEPFVGAALLKLVEKEEIQEMARKAGAKGIRVVGSIETGQELIQRFETDKLSGLTGNWISQEFALATNGLDVFAMDMNCSLPTLGEYAKKFKVKLVPVTRLVRMQNTEEPLEYHPETAEQIAMKLIEMAIENYKERMKEKANVPPVKKEVIAGFSEDVILSVADKLLAALQEGKVKGVVGLVSCTTLSNGPHDSNTVTIAKELIKNDILILSMGCGNAALQVAGLTSYDAVKYAGSNLQKFCEELQIPPVLSFGTCTDTGRLAFLLAKLAEVLDVDIPQLPIAATAPEYMEQKATIDAIFAIAYGVFTHVSPIPPVTGAPNVVKLVTEDVEKLLGGKIFVEEDPVKATKAIVEQIEAKRAALGL